MFMMEFLKENINESREIILFLNLDLYYLPNVFDFWVNIDKLFGKTKTKNKNMIRELVLAGIKLTERGYK